MQFAQAHGGTTGIPSAVFEAELVQQFIPVTVALQADPGFAQVRRKQGVDHYNRESSRWLKPQIRETLGGRLTQAGLRDSSKLMVMAAEAVTVSLGFIAGHSGRHDTHASGARV